MKHDSVLLAEVLSCLELADRQLIIDATLGLGGHTQAILSHPDFQGRVIGIDQDQQHLDYAREQLSPFEDRFEAVQMNFSELGTLIEERALQPDGVLFDLGVASPHFDDPERGFSLHEDGPLDMRMNQQSGQTAADLLNTLEQHELIRIFREYGEERFAPLIAKRVVERRAEHPFARTTELTELVTQVYRSRHVSTERHPATKVFQALRIAVNQEMQVLGQALEAAISGLRPGGLLLVISYHSLEDRMVKQAFKQAADPCICPPKLPVCACGRQPQLRILTKKPIVPSAAEVRANPRARSAKMRVAQKII